MLAKTLSATVLGVLRFLYHHHPIQVEVRQPTRVAVGLSNFTIVGLPGCS